MASQRLKSYHWPEGSVISDLYVEKTVEGKCRLVLIASEKLSDGALKDVPKQLHKYGFHHTFQDAPDGNACLIIESSEHALPKLIDFLSSKQLVKGEPQIKTPETKKEKVGVWKYIQGHANTISGYAGLPGHAAILVAGGMQRDLGRFVAAPMGVTNPILQAAFGNGKSNIDFDDMLHDMGQHFKREGIAEPAFEKGPKRNPLQQAGHFIATHPVQLGFGLGSIGSAGNITSGLRDKNMARVGMGSMSLAGNLVVLGVPEKEMSDEDRDKSPVQRVEQAFGKLGRSFLHPTQIPHALVEFAQDAPFMVNSSLNLMDNAFVLAATHKEIKDIGTNWRIENPAKIAALKTRYAELVGDKPMYELKPAVVRVATGIGSKIKQLERQHAFSTGKPWMVKFGMILPVITSVSFATSTALAMFGSKNRTLKPSEDPIFDPLYARIAQKLSEIPMEERSGKLREWSTYLATRRELQESSLTSDILETQVRKRLDALDHSPWVAAISQQQAAAKVAGTTAAIA